MLLSFIAPGITITVSTSVSTPTGHTAVTQQKRKTSKLAWRDALWGYLFILPQMLGFLFFVVGPLIAVMVFSTQDRNLLFGTATPIGLDNFRVLLTEDKLFWQVMWNTFYFSLLLVPLNIVIALALSLVLARQFRGAHLFRLVYFAPVVTAAAAWAIVWRFILQGENGTLNQFLRLIGIDGPNWLHDPFWAMQAVIVTRVLKNVGLNIVILLGAILNIPAQYDEAARVDGANGWQVLWNIKLPLLAPALLFVSVITLIGSLKVFDHIMLMTAGGPGNSTMVLVYYIYYQAFQFFQTGYASALAVILFVITLALTVVQWVLRKEEIQ